MNRQTMEKVMTFLGLIMVASLSQAQPVMNTTTYDLEAAGLNVGWKVVNAGTENGNIFITYGQPSCNMSVDKDFWSKTYTYKGIAWNFDKLTFKSDLSFNGSEKKSYENTKQALEYAPVFGKHFTLAPTGSVSSAIFKGSGGLVGKLFSADYIGQKVVAADVSVTGFKIAVSQIDTDIITFKDPKTNRPLDICNEIPVYALLSTEPAKEQKGQKWVPMLSDPVPNGGNILFATSGVYDDAGKANYVFRSYNENAGIKKELIFTTDYYAVVTGHRLALPDGKTDYVVFIRTVDYKDKNNLKSNDGTFAEYLRIDGQSLEVKERIQFNSVTTDWLVEKVLEKDGAVYIMGPAGESTKKSGFIIGRASKELTNYQVAKFKGGKVEYVTSTGTDEFEAKSQIIPGVKGKAVANVILLPSLSPREYEIVNGRLMITGQQMTTDKYGIASSLDNMVLWSFGVDGKLAAQYIKPESSLSQSDLIFTKNGNKTYWAIYDYDVWNKVDFTAVSPKDYKIIAPQLQIATIDNSTNKIESFKAYGDEEYAVAFNQELLFDTDTHVGFTGRSLTKKMKDSDLVLVTFKK